MSGTMCEVTTRVAERARVLVVEDDPSLRRAVEVALRGEGYAVQGVDTGVGIERVARQFAPDLGVLDVRLPDGPDGHEVARVLRATGDVPVLFLTAADSLHERLAGFEAGADDYVVKPCPMAELLARVQAVLRRSGALGPSVRRVGDLVVNEDERRATRADRPLRLTGMEFELLAVLARHAGRVVSKAHLLGRVWGGPVCQPNVVEVHMSGLRRKLEAHGPRLIHTVRGAGYLLRG